MNDKMSRIALVLVALVASAFIVKDCGKEDPADSATGVTNAATDQADLFTGPPAEVLARSQHRQAGLTPV